ncbi:transglycosylase SLT domain-containing protein [Sandaracinus amylolyticus]|uniref:Soluble lytic murein transglycosylase n=1 Tax=Sandaracinus amylolyticus TaxID=927083 RepID=A0A0F6YKF9_9BACT|nr:transglycosylase SLT domain-containing protein [Sandaracinus amylolyticus]AKF08835.1 Soluble lytic murein transglycosylase precursor [Sandaracinus amylolyticus]
MVGAASRRTLLGALAALCVTCHSQVSPTPSHADPEPAPPESAPSGFDADVARVDPTCALGTARARLDANDAVEARRIALAASAREGEPDRDALVWIAARGAERAGEVPRAIEAWSSIDAATPLGGWARLAAARAALETDPATAATLLAPLGDLDFPARDEARALEALARARAGAEDGDARLRAAIPNARNATRVELERALADLLASRDDVAARVEALSLLRGIDARGPSTRAGREALERANEVLASLPAERRRSLASPSIEQQIARADALAAAMDHQGAEDAYAALVPRLRDDRARRCDVRLAQGRSMYRRRARREASTLLVTVADECREHEDVRAWARYYAAKSYSALQAYPEAIAQYDVLAEELPGHRLADDALINAARLSEERADPDGMRARLTRVVSEFVGGDMRGEARFLLAWNARREGRLADALAQLDAALAEGPGAHEASGEGAEDVRGRAAYWRGRVLEQLDRASDAAAQYEALARALPLAYYAQHAVARLATIDAARARAVMPATSRSLPPLRFARRAELDRPAFARAVALLRAGEITWAERELEHAGLLAADATPDALWLAAALLDRAGAHSKAMELARRRLRAPLMASMPEGRALALWRIAYPRAYHPLIDDAAQNEGVPASFVRAIAREESSFRPEAVSVAHAYGLMQIIRPTAQRVARPLGLPSDPGALRTPEVNVRIGARYVSGLRRRYDPQHALVPAAYNAGEGAVDRWLRERGDRALDEFIEEIPYDETRRYSRRVLQTWGIYSWLDEGQLPSWPTTLPAR